MDLTHKMPPQVNREDVPRWYGLSYRPPEGNKPPAIVFLILKKTAEQLKAVFIDLNFRGCYAEPYGLMFFEPDLSKGFGFDRVMSYDGEQDGYLRLVMPLDKRLPLLFLAHNYEMLLEALQLSIVDVRAGGDPKRTQLFELRAAVSREGGFNSAPMGGKSSPALRRWVERVFIKRRSLPRVERAMQQTWNALSNLTDLHRTSVEKSFNIRFFNARLGEKGSFFLNTLGNACDVSTIDWWRPDEGEGHHLGCHNLDSPIQQMSLLAGFAALHDLAAKVVDKR